MRYRISPLLHQWRITASNLFLAPWFAALVAVGTAYLAKVACAEHAMKIGTDGVQLLGGHGYCREHPVELWYRNLRAIAILDGVASV